MHAYTHAHNDYQHDRPLHDALAARVHSVEADVWFSGGRFEVSHLGLLSKGTISWTGRTGRRATSPTSRRSMPSSASSRLMSCSA